MANFVAYKAVNLIPSGLPELVELGYGGFTFEIHTGAEFELASSGPPLVFDFQSAAGHPFQYANGFNMPPTGGRIGSMEVDSGSFLTTAYKFTGLSVPVLTFTSWIDSHQIGLALHTMLAGPDTIFGSRFADVLGGFGGNDRINGRAGNDQEIGGSGKDTFVFRPHFGQDVIIDLAAGPTVGDVIEMHGLFHTLAQVRNHAHIDINHHLVIVVDAGDTITLNTVHSKAALSVNDFHFFA